ncbi:Aromatic-ring hydroxylase [Stigmatella aurantiaca DW4/3-1]|uniref:Aromatic-ring hydroxylase n=1 Tax=Stigmatella aurantiaca (strain DW4/3-1) TaxID=378806 RepID=E3FFT5_STIAD|nr:Aromatic-ring hydroxylase [Stigmatella aurantiaca DW4/3-1]
MLAFFEEQFPDAVPLLPELTHDFIHNPTGTTVTVKSTPWHAGGRALVLGDAAHTLVPFFGQGMNCGFEDCGVLDACLERHRTWEDAFAEFFGLRKTNADAIADMAVDDSPLTVTLTGAKGASEATISPGGTFRVAKDWNCPSSTAPSPETSVTVRFTHQSPTGRPWRSVVL